MAATVAVLVPVLNRPHKVAPLLDSIQQTSSDLARTYFIPSPGYPGETEAIFRANGEVLFVSDGSYAQKINRGCELTDEPFIFLAADDLIFRPGWLLHSAAAVAGGARVVGVNDGIARDREHATHFLITRGYAELPTIDGGRGPLCEAYDHNFVDDELIATAMSRGVYHYESRACVFHNHPMDGVTLDDDTYRRGRSNFHRDARTFRRRRQLWS